MDSLAAPLLAGCFLLLGLLVGARLWRRPRRNFVAWHPAQRGFLRRQCLTEPEHFLDLPAVIVSGHPGRQVARVCLGSGPEAVTCYLKRELHVPWGVRLANFLAGFGFVSRSLREAQVLRALEREGLAGPRWLAAGEDGRGRAFLLVAEVAGAVDLPTLLRARPDPGERRRLARQLGVALARLHDAGFEHRDLYAKHVFVDPRAATVSLLDWQRTRRRGFLGLRARARDLAALHATLADELAGPRERLACLFAYWHALPADERLPLRALLAGVQGRAQRLLARRHVREKRQALPAEDQAWICLDGEALCVTPSLRQLYAAEGLDWLGLDRQPAAHGRPVARRWLTLPDQRRTLLVRRCEQSRLRLARHATASPERRQADLLFRLERHGVAAPRLLAMGQRSGTAGCESFLLTEPASDTVRLEMWLARQLSDPPLRSTVRRRRSVLRQVGGLLHRLHEAGCYLDGAEHGLAIRVPVDGPPVAVFDNVDGIRARRGQRPRRARRDVRRLLGLLARAGCGPAEQRRFLAGYGRPEPVAPAVAVAEAAPPSLVRETPAVNRDNLWQRLVRGVRRLWQRDDWPQFAGTDWADRILQADVTDRFHAKQGRSTGRWVLRDPANPARRLVVYLKRHYQLPWWQGVLATLWPRGDWSPAMQEKRHLEWAQRQGLPVPAVVAAGEFTGPWGRLQSFLAVEELTDMLPLHEAIPLAALTMHPSVFRRWKRGLVAEMARLARMLHDRRCFHKDLYLCHFYIHAALTRAYPAGPDGWHGQVHLIDLHRLTHHPWTWRLWQLKDLAQLLYSSEVAGVDARDQVFFWRCYRGLGPRRRADRWLRRCVLLKWQRYRQHNLRRKARRQKEEGERAA
jgi:heptose I phosphotransferase